MTEESDQFKQIEDTLKHIENSISAVFQYPNTIIDKVKDLFLQFLNKINSQYTIVKDNFIKTIPIYLNDIKNTVFTSVNSMLLTRKFLDAIRSVIGRKVNMNYTLPLSTIRMTSKTTNNGIKIEVIDTEIIRTQTTFNNIVIEENINIFRGLFENDKLNKLDIANIIDGLNYLFLESLSLFSQYFITDFSHQQFLEEQISYQQKVEAILGSIKQVGDLDTTRSLFGIITYFGNKYLKIPMNYFEFYSEGNQITYQEAESTRHFYPTHIHINKDPPIFEHNTLKQLLINIENELVNDGITFNKKERLFTHLTFSSLSELRSFLAQQIRNLFGGMINLEYTIISLITIEEFIKQEKKKKAKRRFTTDLSSFFLITNETEFEVKTIDDIFDAFNSQMLHTFYSKDGRVIETIKLINIIHSKTTIEMKPFDLIEYLHDLAFEIKKFFTQTMNLKAIQKKQKYTERWDGSKGSLDVNATATKSLSKGWIIPQQTYRKKMAESPPTVFLIYDLSISMSTIIRSTQFLLITLLSFFDKDVYKLNVGYITNVYRDTGLFKSEERDIETKERKKRAFDLGERNAILIGDYKRATNKKAIYNDKETDEFKQWKVDNDKETIWRILRNENTMDIAKRNLGELINDYHTERYDNAIRDFLDNEVAGLTLTSMDVISLLPRHPDMFSRGLKYVFILTDAGISDEEKIDLVRISRELLQRNDVRYFFIWTTNMSNNLDYLANPETKLHFQTKQYVRRLIDNLITNSDGSFKNNEELSKVNAELQLLVFLYDYYDYVYIVNPDNLLMIGEMKNILHKLEQQKFFIP